MEFSAGYSIRLAADRVERHGLATAAYGRCKTFARLLARRGISLRPVPSCQALQHLFTSVSDRRRSALGVVNDVVVRRDFVPDVVVETYHDTSLSQRRALSVLLGRGQRRVGNPDTSGQAPHSGKHEHAGWKPSTCGLGTPTHRGKHRTPHSTLHTINH
jgi:hypothetical protein